MKPIISPTTGAAVGTQKPSDPASSAHSELGYAIRRPASSRSELAQSETFSGQALSGSTGANLPSKTLCVMSPVALPEMRLVVRAKSRSGQRTALMLASRSDLGALKSSIAAMSEALRPASPEEIGALLSRLLDHYPSAAQQGGVSVVNIARDWISDMSGVSAIGYRAGIAAWRQSSERWKPTPGQILALIHPMEAPVRERLQTALEVEAIEDSMSLAERHAHMRHWLWELQEGLVPFEIDRLGNDARAEFIERETARIEDELATLDGGQRQAHRGLHRRRQTLAQSRHPLLRPLERARS